MNPWMWRLPPYGFGERGRARPRVIGRWAWASRSRLPEQCTIPALWWSMASRYTSPQVLLSFSNEVTLKEVRRQYPRCSNDFTGGSDVSRHGLRLAFGMMLSAALIAVPGSAAAASPHDGTITTL